MTKPLQGLSVLDFSTLLPGPYATTLLADLGADVLKIVSGSRPDLVTLMPPGIPGSKMKASEAWLSRDKRSMFLNLKHPKAKEVVHKLIATRDIVMEQFRPGVMDRLGLGYESLSAVNPALIYCSLTGYGQTGPLASRAGHDINYLARSGLMGYSGRKEGGPVSSGMQIADVASGSLFSVVGILAAVIERAKTGKGRAVDVAMLDGVMNFHAMRGANFLVDGVEPAREDDLLNGGSLYDFYETADGGYLSVGSLEPQFFKAFCMVIGKPEFIPGGAYPKDPSVKAQVREVIRQKTKNYWVDLFTMTDACVEPVLTLQEALKDQQMRYRSMVKTVTLPESGAMVLQVGCPIKFSRHEDEPEDPESTAWTQGYHTTQCMYELGYSLSDIEQFKKGGLFD